MKKQTAVEWLAVQFESIVELNPSEYSKINNAIDQAKKMEETQILDSYVYGSAYGLTLNKDIVQEITTNQPTANENTPF